MRVALVAVAGIALFAQLSCFHYSRQPRRSLTGTCTGACNYYASCKDVRGERISDEVHAACLTECDEVFSSSESLLAFESLVCDDAIAFVEGDSGRQPGEPLKTRHSDRKPAAARR